MIELDKVNKYYYKGKANQIHVIDNTSMTLPDRGIFCLLGPSGCGKTTLLNAIGGLDSVDSGTITVNGQLITRFSSDRIDNIRNANIGYIFQNFNLLDDRSVFENVAIALRMIGIKDDAAVTARVRYCLEKVGIDKFRNRPAGALSGGQRQRVAIARAIVKNPGVIIADEPTGNLDSANTLEIMNIIKKISRDRLVILVTHERNITEFYSDHVAEISDGKIVNIYDNDSSRFLDYQLENRIYLKDMEFHNELRDNNVRIDVYGDTDRKIDIKLAVRGNNIYIDTDGRFNVVDEKSNVKLVNEHYEAMDETYFEDNDFDYNAYFPFGYHASYASLYSLPKMIGNGWNAVKSFKKIKKFFLLGFVFAAMFAFLAVSNVLGLLEVKPVDYRTTNGNYLTIDNPEKSAEMLDLVEELDTVAYVLPGETKKVVTLPLDDYDQTGLASEDITVSVVLTNVLDPETLVAGSMPVDRYDVVIDKFIVDAFLRDDLGKAVGLDSMEEFVGRRITVPNLDEFRITGISDTESPSLFVDQSQAMYILTNAEDAGEDFTFGFSGDDGADTDIVRNGKVRDLDLSKNEIKVTDGHKPEKEFEVIVNGTHKDEMKKGETISTQVAGENLKVVGFYTSNLAFDDTYYVNADTIEKHYLSKQNYFSAYAPDTALLKYMLDKASVPSVINDTRDKDIYINAHKDQLISAIIVAAVIVMISLLEMFIMLRSSFLSRIKEVGTLRAIGLKKSDIYKMFVGEILVITCITAVPGIAVMYAALIQLVKTTYFLQGQYMITPSVAAITFGLLLVFNLLIGLIPVFTTMRKTPAQILARSDI